MTLKDYDIFIEHNIMLLFDIGANIGRWAIANHTPTNRIISVEASPSTYAELQSRVSQYKNIIPLHYAVTSSTDSHVTFYHCNTASTISTLDRDWLSSPESRFGMYANTIQEITVPAISLDRLITEYGVPDLLKIDVEGAENIVLQSLTQKVPLLCFEWAAEWKDKNIQCMNILRDLGYTQFHIQREDAYTYIPADNVYVSYEDVVAKLMTTKLKQDWGMIWAK
jgi:FkbM family methyltransferase